MSASPTHADDKNVSNEGSFVYELYLWLGQDKCPIILLLENAAKQSSNAK